VRASSFILAALFGGAATSAFSTCKAIIFASSPIGLIPGRFDLIDVNEGAISSSCIPSTDVWRGTLDLVTDGPDSRSSRINFNQNESGVRTLEIFVRHPVTSEYRRLQFKPR